MATRASCVGDASIGKTRLGVLRMWDLLQDSFDALRFMVQFSLQ